MDSFDDGAACPDEEEEAGQSFHWHKSSYSVSPPGFAGSACDVLRMSWTQSYNVASTLHL